MAFVYRLTADIDKYFNDNCVTQVTETEVFGNLPLSILLSAPDNKQTQQPTEMFNNNWLTANCKLILGEVKTDYQSFRHAQLRSLNNMD